MVCCRCAYAIWKTPVRITVCWLTVYVCLQLSVLVFLELSVQKVLSVSWWFIVKVSSRDGYSLDRLQTYQIADGHLSKPFSNHPKIFYHNNNCFRYMLFSPQIDWLGEVYRPVGTLKAIWDILSLQSVSTMLTAIFPKVSPDNVGIYLIAHGHFLSWIECGFILKLLSNVHNDSFRPMTWLYEEVTLDTKLHNDSCREMLVSRPITTNMTGREHHVTIGNEVIGILQPWFFDRNGFGKNQPIDRISSLDGH